MESNIKDLEARIEKLEKNIFQLSKTQGRAVELFNEFVEKCAENFTTIQKSFENLTQKVSNL